MKLMIACLVLTAMANASMAAIKTQTIEYKAGDITMKGFLAYDDEKATPDKKAPGVVVFPEWWGMTEYPKKRAEELAKLGYVAFAADMYGEGKTTDDPKEAGKWATEVKGDADLEKLRYTAALTTFTQQKMVDKEKLGAIGYCFGGSMALDMARTGEPLAGVVAFHGDLSTKMKDKDAIATKILICTGGADPMIDADAVAKFQKEMKKANAASVKVIVFPNAQHAFTNPQADSHHIDGIKYNKEADEESWAAMKIFFEKTFGKN